MQPTDATMLSICTGIVTSPPTVAVNDWEMLSFGSGPPATTGMLGRVGTETLRMRSADFELSWSIADLYDDWFNAIRRAVETDNEPVRSL